MPSFPTSVFAPPSRSAGQTIQPAHMNDVQDELNAIEGGYLNATARLNSSGSTVTSLNVTGASTVQGRLTVSSGLSVVGNSTLGSSISLGTLPYVFPSSGGSTGQLLTIISTSGSTMSLEWRVPSGPDGVRAELGSTQAVSSEVTVIRGLTVQTFITNSSLHSTGTNSSRVVPQSTGLYLINAQIRYAVNSTGNRGIQILDSSGGLIARTLIQTSTSAEPVLVQCMGIKRFDVTGGYIRFAANSMGASTLSVAIVDTWMEVVKL